MVARIRLVAVFCTFDVLVFVLCILAFRTVTHGRNNKPSFVSGANLQHSIYDISLSNDTGNHFVTENKTILSFHASVHGNDSSTSMKTFINRTDYRPCSWKITECRRKLPQAIVIGVKKCGTGTLRYFLKFHPQVAFTAEEEMHYFNIPSRHAKGIQWYRRRMSLSWPNQLTIEKTPRYFVSSVAPTGIRDEISPKTKIIVLLRDPVKRSISDYLAVRKTEGLTLQNPVNSSNQLPPYTDPIYDIKSSFENSVLDLNGDIKSWNGLINIGLYSNHLRRWLDVFPRQQILVLDSDTLTHDPLKAFRLIEQFLDLSPFFRPEHFYFSKRKGFYCLKMSGKVSCQGSSKGRTHPTVDQSVIDKLKAFYEPYDKDLVELLGRNFSWIS